MSQRNFYSPFEIVRLDRYSDEIIKLNRNLVIKMNVSLARNVKDSRYFYYREYEYSTGQVKRVSIKRVFDYFLSIEETTRAPGKGSKVYVRINQTDYYPFWNMINTAKEWFTNKKFKDLYGKKDGMLVVTASPVPYSTVSGLPMGITITAFPTVIETGYAIKQGIQMDIDDGKNISSFNIPIEMVFALYTMFPPIYNLYHEANTMLAALDIPIGTNRSNMDDKDDNTYALPSYSEEREYVQNPNGLVDGRRIGQTTTMDDLE